MKIRYARIDNATTRQQPDGKIKVAFIGEFSTTGIDIVELFVWCEKIEGKWYVFNHAVGSGS